MNSDLSKRELAQKILTLDEQELIAYGVVKMEEQLLDGIADIKARVDESHDKAWPTREEIQDQLDSLDEAEQREQFERAMRAVEDDIARVGVRYHELVLRGEGIGPFFDAAQELFVTLHSPVIQESLLIAVSEPYRPRVRDQMQQIGRLFWGWYTVSIPEVVDNEAARTYLRQAGDRWDVDPRELFEQFLGVEDTTLSDEERAISESDA